MMRVESSVEDMNEAAADPIVLSDSNVSPK